MANEAKPVRLDAVASLLQDEVTFWRTKAFALQSRLLDEVDKVSDLEQQLERLRNPAKVTRPPADQVGQENSNGGA